MEGENGSGARLGVAVIGKAGQGAGAFKHKGQRLIVEVLQFAVGIILGLGLPPG